MTTNTSINKICTCNAYAPAMAMAMAMATHFSTFSRYHATYDNIKTPCPKTTNANTNSPSIVVTVR